MGAVYVAGEPAGVEAGAGGAAAVPVGNSPYKLLHVRGRLLVERQRMSAGHSWEKRQRYCHRSGDGAYLMSHGHRPAPNGLCVLKCTMPVGWCRGPLRGRYDGAYSARLTPVTQGKRFITLWIASPGRNQH